MKMMPYEWMTTYTPQREWIEGRGILLWLAFFFMELGAGLYLVSIFLETHWGLVLGWLITLGLGGGLHLAYLGRPTRFWRGVLKPGTSWLSRGLIFVALFTVVGTLQIVLTLMGQFAGVPGEAPALWVKILAGAIPFVLVIYGGFAMNFVSAIPIWNSALIPVLFVVGSIWGGFEVVLGIHLFTGVRDVIGNVEFWIWIFMLGYVFLIVVYLWSILYGPSAGRRSVRELLAGSLAYIFYPVVVVVGMMIPLGVGLYGFRVGLMATPTALLCLGIVCGLLGDLAMRYCILKGALYEPLIPHSAY